MDQLAKQMGIALPDLPASTAPLRDFEVTREYVNNVLSTIYADPGRLKSRTGNLWNRIVHNFTNTYDVHCRRCEASATSAMNHYSHPDRVRYVMASNIIGHDGAFRNGTVRMVGPITLTEYDVLYRAICRDRDPGLRTD